jgi:hypothetical protein
MGSIDVKGMTKKERRKFLQHRMIAMMTKKSHMKLYQEIVVCPDQLLVKLRDRSAGGTNIDQAMLVEQLRQLRITGERVPAPPANEN